MARNDSTPAVSQIWTFVVTPELDGMDLFAKVAPRVADRELSR
jgi:hypothetical protein